MHQSASLLHKINWFLKPVRDIILFFFTTKLGITLLLLSLLLYLILATKKQLTYKKLLYEAARKRPFFNIGEIIGAFFEQVGKLFIFVVNNLTVLLLTLLIFVALLGVSSAVNAVDNFVQNQQKIQNLKTVVKNLSQDYQVAKIKILNYDYTKHQTTFEISYYDYAQKKYLPNKQKITIKGSQIYVLSLVLNFDYSQIETGQKVNLAIPFKVFSDEVKSRDAIPLNTLDSNGVPYIYHRTSEQLYGIDSTTYSLLVREIAHYIKNPKDAKRDGVRSILAASPHNIKYPRRGQVYIIEVQPTGGLTLSKQERF